MVSFFSPEGLKFTSVFPCHLPSPLRDSSVRILQLGDLLTNVSLLHASESGTRRATRILTQGRRRTESRSAHFYLFSLVESVLLICRKGKARAQIRSGVQTSLSHTQKKGTGSRENGDQVMTLTHLTKKQVFESSACQRYV
jgi:hypothetical protein